jgi:hypothetical protein
MDMRFGTWKVRSLCRSGSLKTGSNKGVEEVYGRSDGTRAALNGLRITHSYME